jgi:hypothetical protein
MITVKDIFNREHILNIGDEIKVHNVRGRGGHGAFIIIEKFNKKTIVGTERERSYTPGTKWSVHINSTFSIPKFENGKYVEYWIND